MSENRAQFCTSQSNRREGDHCIVLVTGGSRSGKSRFAQHLAESLPGPRAIVATCPIVDGETAARVERHRADRQGRGWHTIEESENLSRVVQQAAKRFPVILVDCLTLWVNNLLRRAVQQGTALSEDDVKDRCDEVLRICASTRGTFIFVTNELGMGLVPADPVSRHYRDLAGRCNQEIAARADEVVLVTAGIPLTLKQKRSEQQCWNKP